MKLPEEISLEVLRGRGAGAPGKRASEQQTIGGDAERPKRPAARQEEPLEEASEGSEGSGEGEESENEGEEAEESDGRGGVGEVSEEGEENEDDGEGEPGEDEGSESDRPIGPGRRRRLTGMRSPDGKKRRKRGLATLGPSLQEAIDNAQNEKKCGVDPADRERLGDYLMALDGPFRETIDFWHMQNVAAAYLACTLKLNQARAALKTGRGRWRRGSILARRRVFRGASAAPMPADEPGRARGDGAAWDGLRSAGPWRARDRGCAPMDCGGVEVGGV